LAFLFAANSVISEVFVFWSQDSLAASSCELIDQFIFACFFQYIWIQYRIFWFKEWMCCVSSWSIQWICV